MIHHGSQVATTSNEVAQSPHLDDFKGKKYSSKKKGESMGRNQLTCSKMWSFQWLYLNRFRSNANNFSKAQLVAQSE